MKAILKIIAIASLAFFTGCITKNGADSGIENYVVVGDALPEFEVSGPDGTFVSPGDIAGKRAVIYFFRTTCPDCRREMPKVMKAWEKFKNDPEYIFVFISTEADASAVAGYWNEHGYDVTYYMDSGKAAFSKFANGWVPRIYLVGTNGKISYMAIETFEFNADGLIVMIKNLK